MFTGSSLRSMRRRAGLTQAQVAAATGIPVTVISAYERGRRQPGLDAASRIVQALGFRVEFVPTPSPEVRGRRLVQALELAEALPYRPRPLATARR
ncbi:MAG: helix-turn-helix transcriptional regulator [Ilumatobacteraceae bacterium]